MTTRTLSAQELAMAKEHLALIKKLRGLVAERMEVARNWVEETEQDKLEHLAYSAATSGLLEGTLDAVETLKKKLGVREDGTLADVISLIDQSDSGQSRVGTK